MESGSIDKDSTDNIVEVSSCCLRHSVLTGCTAFCDVKDNHFFTGRQENLDGIA